MSKDIEYLDAINKNLPELESKSEIELISAMNLTDDERVLAEDWRARPHKYDPVMENPESDPDTYKKLYALNDKFASEIIRLMLGDELFNKLMSEESCCEKSQCANEA